MRQIEFFQEEFLWCQQYIVFSQSRNVPAIELSEAKLLSEFLFFSLSYTHAPEHGALRGPLSSLLMSAQFSPGHLPFVPFIWLKPSQSDRPFSRFHLGSQSSREQITPGMSNGIENVSSRWVANLNLAQASGDWNSSPHGREIHPSPPQGPGLFWFGW